MIYKLKFSVPKISIFLPFKIQSTVEQADAETGLSEIMGNTENFACTFPLKADRLM